MARTPRSRNDFHIALICALPVEANYIQSVFDRDWQQEGLKFGKAANDSNIYTIGVVGQHNVVVAHMPTMGKVSAATVAANMRFSFPNIRLAIVVGICGGVPYDRKRKVDIHLGDIVVSQALVQYDLGRQYHQGFEVKNTVEDSIGRPSPEIRAFLAKLNTAHSIEKIQRDTQKYLSLLISSDETAAYPGISKDCLFEPTYVHKHRYEVNQIACDVCTSAAKDTICQSAASTDCEKLGCDLLQLVTRDRCADGELVAGEPRPIVHFGRMASGDRVVKSGVDRDSVALTHNVIAFEMEGAGVWDCFPSIVLKGVCDYSDSHKNKVWQKHAAAAAACCVKAVLSEWMPVDNNTEPIWLAPFNHMRSFIGRSNEIEFLESRLFDNTNLRRRVAVFGLGGIGKSRLALEIAIRARTRRLSIFWIDASEHATFENSCLELARTLQIPGYDVERANVKQLVKDFLSNHYEGEWLMLLDNADDEALWVTGSTSNSQGREPAFKHYIPSAPTGAVLVTTRNRRIAVLLAEQEIMELQQVSMNEGIRMLSSVLASNVVLVDVESALQLIEQLAFLPLAIIQAASYINVNDTTIRQYLQLLDDSKREENVVQLLSENFEDDCHNKLVRNTTATTWLVSFEDIRLRNRIAADYLCFMACMYDKDIPDSLLPPVFSEKEHIEAVGVLMSYSFIVKRKEHSSMDQLYDMHRLVRLMTRSWMKVEGTFAEWAEKAARRISEVLLSTAAANNKNTMRQYRPHVDVICSMPETRTLVYRYTMDVEVAKYLCKFGSTQKALDLASTAMSWMECNLGEYDHRTLESYAALGSVYGVRQSFKKSLHFLELAYKGWEKTKAPTTIVMVNCIEHLGYAHCSLEHWAEAESYYEEATRRSEEILGKNNDISVKNTWSLAEIYIKRGRFAEAEHMLLDIITARKEGGVEYDPILQACQMSLGLLYCDQAKFEEAERLLNEVHDKLEQMYGPDSVITFDCKSALGLLYWHMGKLDEAEAMQETVLASIERTAGRNAPSTLNCKARLSATYEAQRRWKDCELLTREVLTGLGESHGPEHRLVLIEKLRLASAIFNQGQHSEALRVAFEMYEAQYRQSGIADNTTQHARKQLEIMLSESGQSTSRILELETSKDEPDLTKPEEEKTEPQLPTDHQSSSTWSSPRPKRDRFLTAFGRPFTHNLKKK